MELDASARKLWNYLRMDMPLEEADCLIVLGSHDLRVAQHGTQLFLEGWAPLIVFSGGRGRITKNWSTTEAERFMEIALNAGVPSAKIRIEDNSTNTGENILFTDTLLNNEGLRVSKWIVVHKPYMGRRTNATMKKLLPEKRAIINTPPIRFETYLSSAKRREEFFHMLVGELQRVMLYPAMGFLVSQNIPNDVRKAHDLLISAGFTRYLLGSVKQTEAT